MDNPLVIIGLAVGIAVITAPIGVKILPQCSPSRPCITGAFSGRKHKHAVRVELPPVVEVEPIKATQIVTPIFKVMIDEVEPTYYKRNYGKPYHEPNQATKALMGQLEEPEETPLYERFYQDENG